MSWKYFRRSRFSVRRDRNAPPGENVKPTYIVLPAMGPKFRNRVVSCTKAASSGSTVPFGYRCWRRLMYSSQVIPGGSPMQVGFSVGSRKGSSKRVDCLTSPAESSNRRKRLRG